MEAGKGGNEVVRKAAVLTVSGGDEAGEANTVAVAKEATTTDVDAKEAPMHRDSITG